MMKGVRDTMQDGPHTVRLDGVVLAFDAEGVLWEPSAEQEAVLAKSAERQARFTAVEPMGKSPVDTEFATGVALFAAGDDEGDPE